MRKKSRNTIKGTITIEDGAKIWPHELLTAMALANAGYTVRFIPNNASLATADAYINNTLFEFKSPEGTTIKSVENNLQKALRRQSKNIVIDCARIKKVREHSIIHYLEERVHRKQGIKRLLLVTRKERKVIDITEKVR